MAYSLFPRVMSTNLFIITVLEQTISQQEASDPGSANVRLRRTQVSFDGYVFGFTNFLSPSRIVFRRRSTLNFSLLLGNF